jgi:hypothetical protein
MSSGDYTIGLMTIITGLAIADMVASMHGLLMSRHKVRWDWLAMLSAIFIFMLIVSSWGISFRTMANENINPPLWLFVLGLSQIIPLYLAARASLPDAVEDKGVTLAEHYANIRRYFWGSVAFTYFMFVAYGLYVLGIRGLSATYISPAAQLIMMAVLMLTPNRRIHAAVVPVIFALFCYNHLLSPMFSDQPWLAGPHVLT